MNMKWSLHLGRFAGIKVSIHWTFVILLVWIFMVHYRMHQDTLQALMGVVFILALFLCVTLHEFGHALTAKKFDIDTRSITLLPIGGLARLERFPDSPKEELLVAIAGPLVNLAIGAVIFLLLLVFHRLPTVEEMENLMNFSGVGFWLNLLIANLVLAVFNLIPAFPMDGGRILRAMLLFKFSREKATRIAAGIGQVLAIGFVFLGFYGNFWLILIGIFIFLGAGAEADFEMTKSILADFTVKDVLMKHFPVLHPDDALEKAVQLMLDGQAHDFIIAENGEILGVLTRKSLIKGLSENGNSSPVSVVMQTDFIKLEPNMRLQEVYQKIMISSCPVAPVIENGHFIGIVDKENINEFIMVKQATANKAVMGKS